VAEDLVIQKALISIELSCVEKSRKQKRSDPWNQKIRNLLVSLENESKWSVLTNGSTPTNHNGGH
jgi:hypothetical protein